MKLGSTVTRVVLLTPESEGLAPEDIAAATPFVLLRGEVPSQARSTSEFFRLHLGLKSGWKGRSEGRWWHREDWLWLHESDAFAVMGALHGRGCSSAVLTTNARFVGVLSNSVYITADAPGLENHTWVVDASALVGQRPTWGRAPSYLRTRRFTRSRVTGPQDARAWHAELLETVEALELRTGTA